MIQIPLTVNPNQALTITLDSNIYDINIQACRDNADGSTGVLGVDITRNGVVIVTGVRPVAGFPIIPAEYLEDGNFIFSTMNEEYPDWRQFGTTQYLIFASKAEIEALNVGT